MTQYEYYGGHKRFFCPVVDCYASMVQDPGMHFFLVRFSKFFFAMHIDHRCSKESLYHALTSNSHNLNCIPEFNER